VSNGNDNTGGPDPGVTVDQATNWFSMLSAFAATTPTAGFVQQHAALTEAMKHVRTPSIVASVFGGIFGLLANIAAACLQGIEDIKSNGGDGINNLTAVTLSELLGVDVSISSNASSGSGNPTVDASATGAAVFNTLAQLFGGLQPISPDQGATNAKEFLGFGVNFAVITAFLGIIGGMVPEIHLDELKGIGEEVRSSLGLGRLTHTAITPLVRNMIAQPLDLWLRAQLRPDRLAEAQLVRALRAGLMEESDVRQGLAEKGYTDDAIDFLLTDLSVKLGMSDLILLLNNGDITEQDVINNLTLTGMPEDQAQLQLKASQLGPARTQQLALLSELETAYVGGFVTQEQYNAILANLSLGDLEEQNFRAKVGFKQEVPRKVVSFAEVKSAIVENIVDFSYLDTWFASEGYDQQSQMIMTYQVLEAIKNAENKVLFAKYKAQVLTKAGKPVPPWITAAEQPM
jgi:hypothetical protein